MSEIKLPIKINGDAEQIAAENLSGIVNRYLSRRDPQSEFVKHEVAIICGYINENPLPKNNLTQTVLIGSWKKHSETGLYLRIGITPSESETGLDTVSLVLEDEHEGNIKWAYKWRGNFYPDPGDRQFKHYEPNFGLSLDELRRAHELSREFIAAAQSYFLMVDYRRRNL